MSQLGGLETLKSDFESRGALLIAISYQSEADAGKSVEKSGVTFPILADIDHQVADLYGVYGLETSQSNKTIPAVFVIDQNGNIYWAYLGKRDSDRPDAQLVLDNVPK
jgi:peroxiredoxin Q/BCP